MTRPAFWKLTVGFQVTRAVAVQEPESGRSWSTMLRWASLLPPWMSSPGWALRFSEPPSTERNWSSRRTTLQREVSSVVPSNWSLPGHEASGGYASMSISTLRERSPSLTVNVAVYSPGSSYVWLAFAVVASVVPSFVKSHAYWSGSPSASVPVPVKFTASAAGPATLSAVADAVGEAFDATPLPMNVNSSRSNRSVARMPGRPR